MAANANGMNRRDFLSMLGAGAAGAVAGQLLTRPRKAFADVPHSRKPNIILILTDDCGYADLGSQGSQEIPTPNLEALAASSVRFTDAYSTGWVCSPARSGLVMGRWQHRFRMTDNGPGPNQIGQTNEKTIAGLLKPAGYATGMIGKWHLGDGSWDTPGPIDSRPISHGFDEFFGFPRGWAPYDLPRAPIYRGNANGWGRVSATGYASETFGDEAADFIDRHKSEPFFLYVAFNAPHTTLMAPAELLNKFRSTPSSQDIFSHNSPTPEDRILNAAVITGLDIGVGRILDKLKQLNLDEDTIVIYTNDNGGPNYGDYMPGTWNNYPLQGHKATSYDGGVRVPFMVRWTGHITPGASRVPVISLDIARTALAAAEVAPPTVRPLDGANLLPLLTGQATTLPERNFCWSHDGTVIRRGKWKYRHGSLYDMETDPGETTNVSAANPGVGSQLQSYYDAWLADVTP